MNTCLSNLGYWSARADQRTEFAYWWYSYQACSVLPGATYRQSKLSEERLFVLQLTPRSDDKLRDLPPLLSTRYSRSKWVKCLAEGLSLLCIKISIASMYQSPTNCDGQTETSCFTCTCRPTLTLSPFEAYTIRFSQWWSPASCAHQSVKWTEAYTVTCRFNKSLNNFYQKDLLKESCACWGVVKLRFVSSKLRPVLGQSWSSFVFLPFPAFTGRKSVAEEIISDILRVHFLEFNVLVCNRIVGKKYMQYPRNTFFWGCLDCV